MPFIDPDMIWLPKALAQAGLSSVGTRFVLGAGAYVKIPYLQTSAPMWLVSAGLGFAGSLLTDGIHNFVRDEVHLSKKHTDEASLFLGALVSGFLLNGGLYVVNADLPSNYGMVQAFGVGAGSEIASSILVGGINDML